MTRDDLKQYKYLKQRINSKIEKYEEDFAKITKMSTLIDGMPKAKNKPNYSVEDFIDASNEIMVLYKEDVQKQKDIEEQLRLMNNEKYYTVLYLRYIVYATEKNPLEKVASIMNYSYNETCKINGKALNKFDELNKLHKNA